MVNLNVLNVAYPGRVREMGIQEARPVLGDLVRDAQRHGIETLITRNGRPAARIARLGAPGDNAAECEKILAGYASDAGAQLTGSDWISRSPWQMTARQKAWCTGSSHGTTPPWKFSSRTTSSACPASGWPMPPDRSGRDHPAPDRTEKYSPGAADLETLIAET